MSETEKIVEVKKAENHSRTSIGLLEKIKRIVFSFRPEEFIAAVAFFPMAYLTIKAYLFFKSQSHIPNVFRGDMQRLIVVVIIILFTYLIVRMKSGHPA